MPDQTDPSPSEPAEPAMNRAQRRGAKKKATAAADAARYHGDARQSGSAHPGAQGRRVVPIRRTG